MLSDNLITCGCGTIDCCAMPPEFVRVRYYFGQRLGVMELNDEAAYHAGKQAFHNARLHGAGVLCGLRAERFVFPAGTTATTVLRVTKGAALDWCGREIVVGADQCIDLAAWFAANRARPELKGWTAGTQQNLNVVLCYRECPSDPSIVVAHVSLATRTDAEQAAGIAYDAWPAWRDLSHGAVCQHQVRVCAVLVLTDASSAGFWA